MKLLQIPTASIEQRIQEELEINPILEEIRDDSEDEEEEPVTEESEPADEEDEPQDETSETEEAEEDPAEADDASLDDYIEDYLNDDDELASYKLNVNNHSPDEEEKVTPIAVENSFLDYLEEQASMIDLTEKEKAIAFQIIGSIDDDGYIRRDLLSLTDDLAFSQGVQATEFEVLMVLRQIQQFDPPGIAARDLRECLLIQLKRKKNQSKTLADKVCIDIGIEILDRYFEEFTRKHYDKLLKYLEIEESVLKEVLEFILHLNPKPASGYASGGKSRGNLQYIVPDFIVENVMGELELTINRKNAPDLRINEYYKQMLRAYVDSPKRSKADREAVSFIRQKIESAKWFIDAMKQRYETLFNTMYSIMQYQKEYFLTGDDKRLKPMILKDIADITDLDISTISRVASSKYVQTEFGTRRLKDFFSESLHTESGEEMSTLEVKTIILEMVQNEDKRKPISDETITDALHAKGLIVSRRTIAKYREQLNIPVARLRKKL